MFISIRYFQKEDPNVIKTFETSSRVKDTTTLKQDSREREKAEETNPL